MNKKVQQEAIKLISKYMEIAQPDKPAPSPHPKTIKTGLTEQRLLNLEARGLFEYLLNLFLKK